MSIANLQGADDNRWPFLSRSRTAATVTVITRRESRLLDVGEVAFPPNGTESRGILSFVNFILRSDTQSSEKMLQTKSKHRCSKNLNASIRYSIFQIFDSRNRDF